MDDILLYRRRRRRVTSAFVPTSIANLALWLDANDSATITQVAGAVSQWNDKSGNGYNATQGTGSRQPITNTRTINSKNTLDFDGTNDGMSLPSGLYTTLPNAANSIFIVFQSDNTGDADQTLIAGQIASSGVRYEVAFSTTLLEVQNRFTSNSRTTTALTRDTTAKAVGFIRSGTTITPIVSGVAGTAGTNSENNNAITTLTVGSLVDFSTNRFNGMIAEIIAYNSALSNANANLVGNYLASKWGITWTGL